MKRIAIMLCGVVVGVSCVELLFRTRDHGAFPHLNVYVADDQRGVRLAAGTTERISFSNNPVTDVRINAQGYRGADWPAHADNELFVVGDSQAFGLGVQEDESFPTRLGAALHRPVANAAVPTYGPDEYEAVLREELPRRHSKTVLYVVNIANDLFEASHPNRDRHAVWDGWAVRKETAPSSITHFPGRALLYRDSHAFFALRRAWFQRAASNEGAVPSEGTWSDIVREGTRTSNERAILDAARAAQRKTTEAQLERVLTARKAVDEQVGKVLYATIQDEDAGASTLQAARAQPGDIVRVEYGEGSQPVALIAEQIARAADVRQRFEAALRAKHDRVTLDALATQDKLDDTWRTLHNSAPTVVRSSSPLRPALERVAVLCKENGAELVVVVLPLDVQVSADEWHKYGATPIDMRASRALVDDVLAVSRELGARTVDAWPALTAAEPGAFLAGDLHMTPKATRPSRLPSSRH